MNWLQIELSATADSAPVLEAALEAVGAVSVTMTDARDQPLYEPGPGETPLWNELIVTGLFTGDTDRDSMIMALAAELLPEALPEFRTQVLEEQNWQRAWIDSFQPMRFGERLWICPSWRDAPDPEAVNLLLDPGLAFGTGTHPTTALCLEWLDANDVRGQTLVDYGCGSGILGIAALLLGADCVLGVDTDPQALVATRDNCLKNSLSEAQFPVCLPDDFPALLQAHRADGRVDGILANILAEPLIQLAEEMAARVRPGGWLLLSGILDTQAAQIVAAYRPWFDVDPPVVQDCWVRISARRHES